MANVGFLRHTAAVGRFFCALMTTANSKKMLKPGSGRTTTRTAAVVAEILERLERGEAVIQMCRDEHLPTARTVYNWLDEDPNFLSQYQRAREVGFDHIAVTMRDTARGLGDSSGDVARDKLIVDTDFKLLSKWSPKKYGDKLQHTGDGGGPISVQVYIPDNGRDKP
jgi:hypothetical protein